MHTQGDRRPRAARGRHTRLTPALAAAMLAIGAACGGGSARYPGTDARGSGGADTAGARADGGRRVTEVPYDSVFASAQSGVESPLRAIVRTPDAWAAVWGRIAASRGPASPPPPIDFGNSMLVAVGLGSRPSGGFAARIAGIEAHGDTLTVKVREIVPGAGCMATMALTAPVVVVRIDRRDAEFEFVETRQERACD